MLLLCVSKRLAKSPIHLPDREKIPSTLHTLLLDAAVDAFSEMGECMVYNNNSA